MRRMLAFGIFLSMTAEAQVDSTMKFLPPAGDQPIVFRCRASLTDKEILYMIDGTAVDPAEIKRLRSSDIVRVDVLRPENFHLFSCTPRYRCLVLIATKQNTITVTDADDGHGIDGTTVTLRSGRKKAFHFKTDSTGRVDFGSMQATPSYELQISCVGYVPQKISMKGKIPVRYVQLKKEVKLLQEVLIIDYRSTRHISRGGVCSNIRTHSENNSSNERASASLFPNPAPRHGRITLRLPQKGEKLIEIVNSPGCVVQRLSVVGDQTDLQLNLNSAGIYFARVTNQQTKNFFTTKLLVQ